MLLRTQFIEESIEFMLPRFVKNKIYIIVVMYSLYLYFKGMSLRNTLTH